MNRPAKFFASMMFVVVSLGVAAQQPMESFDEFRKSLLDNYNNYRSDALGRYCKYLDSLWVEYPQHAGIERNPFPKPIDVPIVDGTDVEPEEEAPSSPDNRPGVGGASPLPEHTGPVFPQEKGKITISFYGIPLTMPDVEYTIPDNISRNTVSKLWQQMYDGGLDESVISGIRQLASELNLNDYLIYELTQRYVHAKFRNHTPFSRNALTHFLLSNMGYDVRLAETETGKSLILLPFNQMVYARTFLNIGEKKYFVFSEDSLSQNEAIYTCFLPSDMFLGNMFELKLKELRLPYKPYRYTISDGSITLTGEVNANMYPILYHYPQMPICDYAQSIVSGNMRKDIIGQLRVALEGDTQKNMAEKLLHFAQYAFMYATDDENHGFEKPYFFEEMVYYPKCDCEDRAIFYSYLLYNVAGIENHIISYPGHEANSLTLSSGDQRGTSYNYDGKKFFISDPTYIGASTGMCMPDFESIKPTIDYVCK